MKLDLLREREQLIDADEISLADIRRIGPELLKSADLASVGLIRIEEILFWVRAAARYNEWDILNHIFRLVADEENCKAEIVYLELCKLDLEHNLIGDLPPGLQLTAPYLKNFAVTGYPDIGFHNLSFIYVALLDLFREKKTTHALAYLKHFEGESFYPGLTLTAFIMRLLVADDYLDDGEVAVWSTAIPSNAVIGEGIVDLANYYGVVTISKAIFRQVKLISEESNLDRVSVILAVYFYRRKNTDKFFHEIRYMLRQLLQHDPSYFYEEISEIVYNYELYLGGIQKILAAPAKPPKSDSAEFARLKSRHLSLLFGDKEKLEVFSRTSPIKEVEDEIYEIAQNWFESVRTLTVKYLQDFVLHISRNQDSRRWARQDIMDEVELLEQMLGQAFHAAHLPDLPEDFIGLNSDVGLKIIDEYVKRAGEWFTPGERLIVQLAETFFGYKANSAFLFPLVRKMSKYIYLIKLIEQCEPDSLYWRIEFNDLTRMVDNDKFEVTEKLLVLANLGFLETPLVTLNAIYEAEEIREINLGLTIMICILGRLQLQAGEVIEMKSKLRQIFQSSLREILSGELVKNSELAPFMV